MSVMQEDIAVSHPQMSYPFVIADVAASQSDLTLFRVSTSASAKIDAIQAVMPWPGSIVALAVVLSANKTAGTLTFSPSINGAAVSFDVAVANDTAKGYGRAPHGTYRFNAGDLLGAMYSSDANLQPTTADAVVDVYVVFDRVNV